MILLTDDLRERLLANGRDPDADHVPVVKFFNPLGDGVWLATELDADGDTMFGLADLGDPEIGSFSLSEMTSVRLPFGMGIERDILCHRPAAVGLGRGCPPGGEHPGRGAHRHFYCPSPARGIVIMTRPLLSLYTRVRSSA